MSQDDIAGQCDVFVSYAHLDADHDVANARKLAEWLESEGYKVWWDRHLLSGDWQEQLKKKADSAAKVILLWSPRSAVSKAVYAEAFIAAANGTLFPVIIEEDEKFPLLKEWHRFQYVKLTDFERQKADILAMLPPPLEREQRPEPPMETDRVSIVALPTGAGRLIGRDAEKTMLANAWNSTGPGAPKDKKTNIVVLHAIGGAGKTALMRNFVDSLGEDGFAGAHKVYGWSAYSQGSGDNRNASADEFIGKALAFFGHDLAKHPIPDAVERGRKLAALVGKQRSLLVIDGLEPLQDPPLVNKGRLKDRGIAALIGALAMQNAGLLIITSRQELPELEAFHEPRVLSRALNQLSVPEGVALLAHRGVHGKRSEMEKAVTEVLGHALTLNLLGSYLDAVHGGDVNQREQFDLGAIVDTPADYIGDETARYAKRAARIMEGMIARFKELAGRTASGGDAETAILCLTGLFDRPAEKEALDVLLAAPAIPGLTDAFHGLSGHQRAGRWHVAVDRLRKLRLLNEADKAAPGDLDAHPIVRAHFGSWLKEHAPEAYREAHSRLYDFYRYRGLPDAFRKPEAYGLLALVAGFPQIKDQVASVVARKQWPDGWVNELGPSLLKQDWTKLSEAAALIGTAAFDEAMAKFLPDTVEAMRNCFAAIGHGCAARRHREAYSEVYIPRVVRGNEQYLVRKLGALNAGLAALANFFDALWDTPVPALRESDKARVLAFAAFALRALGRLREALQPFEATLKVASAAKDWKNAAIDAGNVSELRLTLGDVAQAAAAAKESVDFADRSGDAFQRMSKRAAHADALHQAGAAGEALALFREAEAMQAERQPSLPRLYSLRGYRYCDVLLARGEADAVAERAQANLKAYQNYNHAVVLDIALDNLSLGRAYASLRGTQPRSNPARRVTVLSRTDRRADPGSSQTKVFDRGKIPDSRYGGFRDDGGAAGDFQDDNERLAAQHLDAAVEGLRRAGQEDDLPRGLLARAAFRRATGDFDAADTDLREVNEIASRGEMRLHLTDYHLETARLLLAQLEPVSAEAASEQQTSRRRGMFDWLLGAKPVQAAPAPAAPAIPPAEAQAMRSRVEEHYAEAQNLIDATGYKRRLPELAAIRACLDGEIPAHILDPDRDRNGRPAAAD